MPDKHITGHSRPAVSMIFRKRVAHFFSLEKIFFKVAELLEQEVAIDKQFAPHYTSGIKAALKNIQWARSRPKADIYHITGDIHYAVLGCPKSRTILTIHDCGFMYNSSGLKRWFMHRLFLKWPVRHSRIVTTISEQTKSDIIGFTGCSADKVVVIPNPVGNIFSYREVKFNKERPTLLFVGTTPNKNLIRVAEALSGISCVLDIIGPVPEEVGRLLDQNKISWQQSSKLSEEALAAKYSGADALLFPTTFEGFGLPILEAQLTGVPVITSNLSPMKEVAGGGALLVDPYDPRSIRDGVISLIQDDARRSMLISQGLENARLYSAEKIARQYLNQYMTVVNK